MEKHNGSIGKKHNCRHFNSHKEKLTDNFQFQKHSTVIKIMKLKMKLTTSFKNVIQCAP